MKISDANKAKLKPCPCGKTPKELAINTTDCKWFHAGGSCCGEWEIEFRSNYTDATSGAAMELAIAAWNDAPRG